MEMKWWPQVGSSLPVTSYTVGDNRQTYALRSLVTFLLFISAYLMALSPHILANFGALETLTKGQNALSLFVGKVTPENATDKRVRNWFLFTEILNEHIDIHAKSRIYTSEYGL